MDRRGFLRRSVSVAVGVALAPIAAKLLPADSLIPYNTTVRVDQIRIVGVLKPKFMGHDGADFGIIPID